MDTSFIFLNKILKEKRKFLIIAPAHSTELKISK